MALTAVAWIALATIWGTTFLAIRVGLNTLPPITFAGMRFVLGAALLGMTLRPRGIPLPQTRAWCCGRSDGGNGRTREERYPPSRGATVRLSTGPEKSEEPDTSCRRASATAKPPGRASRLPRA